MKYVVLVSAILPLCAVAQVQASPWTWEPHLHLGSRYGHAMAEDPVRERVVSFGGNYAEASFNHAFDTWEWDGSRWFEQRPAAAPPPRIRPAMAYDAVRGAVVLFGGHDNSHVRGDMWEWDGQTWREILPRGAWPPVRSQHAMASDPQRQRIVMFGGLSPTTVTGHLDDTWEWDGNAWTTMAPQVIPTMRHFHAMAYSQASGRVMLYGGGIGALFITPVSDPWYEWDGNDWTYFPVAPPGPGLWELAPYRSGVVLTDQGVTWQHDGVQWTRLNLPMWHGARSKEATAALTSRQQVVHYGGVFGGPTNSRGEPTSRVPSPDPLDRVDSTWTFASGAWRREAPQPDPELEIARVAADPSRDRSLLLGVCATGGECGAKADLE